MDEFDGLVDQLLNGDALIADFDSGITLTADLDSIGITYEDEDGIIDIILDKNELDFLHLMLEALFVANGQIKDVNWNAFLDGAAEG